LVVDVRHKGLKRLFAKGSTRGIQHDHEKKLRRILAALDAATRPADLDLPGYDLHPLKGNRAGTWSVSVSGNWRVTFRFDGNHVTDVDDEDHH
jgi:toxin HigB-1